MRLKQDRAWITDSFSIRKMCVEYVDSHFEATEFMHIGSYILPPMDLEGSIGEQIKGFFGGFDEGKN